MQVRAFERYILSKKLLLYKEIYKINYIVKMPVFRGFQTNETRKLNYRDLT